MRILVACITYPPRALLVLLESMFAALVVISV